MRNGPTWYQSFRAIGYRAVEAHRAARIVEAFRNQNRFEIRAMDEEEDYFSVYGEPDDHQEREDMVHYIEQHGAMCVYAWDTLRKEMIDSIGMCVYAHPCSPIDNEYVVELMATALQRIADDCPACHGTGKRVTT